MKNLLSVFIFALLSLGATNVNSQTIKLLNDTVTDIRRNPRLIFAEDQQVYALSFPVNSDFPIMLEQLVPVRAVIRQFNFGSVSSAGGCAIRNNKICMTLNEQGSNFPRVIIIDIPTGNTLLDTIYSLYKPPYFSFSANRVISDSVGNFYVNLYLFDSTQQRSASHMRINPAGEMAFRSCDLITYPETPLVRATENECTYTIWAESAVTVSSDGTILHIDSFPTENAVHWVLNGRYAEEPEINGSNYYTLSDRFTGYGMIGKVTNGKTKQTFVHLDTMMSLTDIVITHEEGFFLVGNDSLENIALSQQTIQGDVIADTIIQKRGNEFELLLSQSSYEEQNGSITVMQMLRTNSEFYTRFLTFGRTPHAPFLSVKVFSLNQHATLRWNVPLSGGLPITSYLVQYKKHTETQWSTPQTVFTDSLVLTNLIASQEYDCRVQAVNELGASVYSNTVTFQTTGNVGINEHDLTSFNVFPNPVQAGGYIHASGSFELYDVLGNKLPASDVAPHMPGIYIIHITQNTKDSYRKLVVE